MEETNIAINVKLLNQLYKDFKNQPKTDLKRLEKIREVLEEIVQQTEIKPLYSLPLEGNEQFLFELQKIDDIVSQKSYAVQQKDFEKAAQLRDKERKAYETFYAQLGFEIAPNHSPFLEYQGVIYYYDLDSRVVGLLVNN